MGKVRKPTVQAHCKVAKHGSQTPVRIVLHDTESHDTKGIGDVVGVYSFWQRQGKGYGAHIVVGKDGETAQGATGGQTLWHVASHNSGSIGVEMIGFARFTLRVWLARRKQLDKVAKWLAWWSDYYDIPLVHSTTHGVCMHSDFHGGHTDPGVGFPFRRVLKKARAYKKNGW